MGWAQSFLQRHMEVLRKAPARRIEPERQAVTLQQIQAYFESLKSLMQQFSFHTDHICNADETMVQVNTRTRKRTVVPRRDRYGVVPADPDCLHITLLLCGFATGDLAMNP
ncbi:MAG: hypothetical protein AB7K41_16185 [Bdellovibrionales bacterium]